MRMAKWITCWELNNDSWIIELNESKESIRSWVQLLMDWRVCKWASVSFFISVKEDWRSFYLSKQTNKQHGIVQAVVQLAITVEVLVYSDKAKLSASPCFWIARKEALLPSQWSDLYHDSLQSILQHFDCLGGGVFELVNGGFRLCTPFLALSVEAKTIAMMVQLRKNIKIKCG